MIGCGNASQRRAHPIILMVTYAHLAFLPTNRYLHRSIQRNRFWFGSFMGGHSFALWDFHRRLLIIWFATSFGALF